jgi:hypothetical protein
MTMVGARGSARALLIWRHRAGGDRLLVGFRLVDSAPKHQRKKWETHMGKINVTRVLLGGLLAGLVLNIGEYVLNDVILAEQWAAYMAEAGMDAFGVGQIAAFVILTFLFGIVLIWIYAAIRPRFGPGPKTAVIAGLTMWAIAWLLVGASFMAAGMFPGGLTVTTIVWGLFEVPIAALAGAWLYTENGVA